MMDMAKPRILIVDDVSDNIRLLRHFLSPEYKFFFALNGQDALEAAATNPPDLILLDIVMPELDGFAVCTRLKAMEETRHIPVIFITSKNDVQDETHGLALGAVDFITKPFNPPIVKARIQTHLNLIHTFAQLRERENHLRSILDNAMDAIITTDAAGRILDLNLAAEHLFGYSEHGSRGREVSSLIVPPEWREQHLGKMHHFVQHAKAADTLKRRFESTAMRSDGDRIDVEIALVGSHTGQEVTFTAFIHDITERRILLDSLNQTLKAAEVANRAKSEFLANMSHEIRTPMNAIIGLTHLALKAELTPKLQDYLLKIDQSSHSMLGIINDILDFSRIEAGKMRLTPVAFQLQAVFDHLHDMFAHQISAKGMVLQWSIAQDMPPLWGDAMRLEQVLTNLVGNALKFTERGEIVVQAQLREQYTRRVVIEFTVRDSGIGIAPARVTELFEPFVQADGSITRKYGGTGLGLVICKRIVNMMGGEIGVESCEGVGSTFHFTAVFEPQSDQQGQGLQPTTGLHRLKVLLVGEPGPALLAIEKILHSLTFVITTVSDLAGSVAALQVAHVADAPYALLLLHQQAPGQEGVTLFTGIAQALQGLSPPLAMPKSILLLSGVDAQTEQRARDAGIQACFSQPVKRSLLFNTLLTLFGVTAVYSASADGLANTDNPFKSVLGGIRVLVVEDNPINRQVIRELLERVGVTVEEANHGGTALRLLQTASYDLVLMDVQMPEMDGLTATRIIRSNRQFDTLPIIAMTAHAMEEDKQKCLEVGMNDHIGKPIDLKELYRTLAKWATAELSSDDLPVPVAPGDADPFPDLPGVDTAVGLERLAGNRALYRKLLHQLYEDHAQDAERIAQAWAEQDHARAERLAHTLKSIAGQLGAHALHKAARNLEEGIAQESGQIESLMQGFADALAEVISALATWSCQPSAVAVPVAAQAGDGTDLAPLLQQLAILLREQDSKADTLLEPLSVLLQGHKAQPLCHAMTQHLKQYDYESALHGLLEIAQTVGVLLE
ncbi:MAG: response regulator [Magnetococcales bacterium]|nr:response regulator [Magnetococcales bacterium]